jgi:hypothetical protein
MPRPQFRLSNIFCATFSVALIFAAWQIQHDWPSHWRMRDNLADGAIPFATAGFGIVLLIVIAIDCLMRPRA